MWLSFLVLAEWALLHLLNEPWSTELYCLVWLCSLAYTERDFLPRLTEHNWLHWLSTFVLINWSLLHWLTENYCIEWLLTSLTELNYMDLFCRERIHVTSVTGHYYLDLARSLWGGKSEFRTGTDEGWGLPWDIAKDSQFAASYVTSLRA